MSTYCTAEDAARHGATTDVSVATLEAAAAVVDVYTGTWFDQRAGDFTLEYDGTGVLYLPAPAVTVTAVTVDSGAGAVDLPYRVVADRLYLPDTSRGHDVLVAGAEPWNGGWAGLLGRDVPRLVTVTGTLGLPAVPAPVREAAAMLAATLSPAPYAPQVDAEGVPQGTGPLTGDGSPAPDAETVTPQARRREVTTGLAAADRLLEPWRAVYRSRWKVG